MRRVLLVIALLVLGTAPAEPAESDRSFTIAAGGDILIHRTVATIADGNAPGAGAYDFSPMLMPIEPWVAAADLAICHLEGTLTPTNTGLSFYPAFNAPHEVADAIAAAGYDACSTAGNHAMDRGFTGVTQTLDILDGAGLGHAGTARTPEERLPSLYDANGVTVGHISATYGLNGIPRPEGKPWAANVIGNGDAVLDDAAWARDHGAEFVIVSLHWGAEYQVRPTAGQEALAERLLASPDIDLILGHHVHVIQPIDRIGGEVVVYGMGNQLSNQRGYGGIGGTEDGIMVHHTVRERNGRFRVTRAEYTPTWVHPTTKEVLPVAHTLATDPGGHAAALRASWVRTLDRVGRLGVEDLGTTTAPWPLLVCRGEVATIAGTAGPDVITGTAGPDVIVGLGGDDVIDTGDGNDLVCAGDGDDLVRGGDGDDLLFGGSGSDSLAGGPGNDRLWGNTGDDLLDGDVGDDRLWAGPGDDTIRAGFGDDAAAGGPGVDRLLGGRGADLLRGGAEDDFLYGEEGGDHLFGEDGDDRLWGGVGHDHLAGGDGADTLRGGAGPDTLRGGDGDDALNGEGDDDLLGGGGGTDHIVGGVGVDTCRAGPSVACEG